MSPRKQQVKQPVLAAVEDGGASALSELLEQHRKRTGMTYQQIRNEIEMQFGVNRSESAVRFCIQGRAGNAEYRHRGARIPKAGEPSTLMLVAGILGVPPQSLRRAYAADLLEQGLGSLEDITAYTGYFTQAYVDLLLSCVVFRQSNPNEQFHAHTHAHPA